MLRRCLPLFAFVVAVLSLADAQTPLRLVNVTPCRLVDTRQQNHGAGFKGTMSFNLPQLAQSGGSNGCPHFSLATAQAYSLNVTLVTVDQHPVGYLTIWPTGETQPVVSLMNSDGRTKANAAIVPAGTNGEVSVYVTDTTNVLIDIDAYFDGAGDPAALAFYSLEPCRLVDTRQVNNGAGFHGTMTFNLPLSSSGGGAYGSCSPFNLSAAQAYSLNVTALPVNGGSLGYLSIWPAGETQPVVSTLNDNTGTVVANAAIVPAGSQQQTDVYAADQTNLLIDINGYFAPAVLVDQPLSLYNVTPCRVLDTRGGIGLFNGTIPVDIVGSSCGIPSAAEEAFVLNATVVPDGPVGYLTLWPANQSKMPTVSTLNAYDGAVTSNMAIVPSNNAIDAFVPTNSQTQLILDISAYFAPVAALSIETTSLPDGTQNSGYSAPLVAIGGIAPYTWVQAGGHLPPGLSIGSSGTISGKPSSTGTYNFGVQATDSNSPAGVVTAGLQITVNSTAQTLAITTTSLPNATVNTPYNALLAANGGVTPYSWSILSGSLPTGLSLNGSTGQISGVPGAAGLYNFTVKVTDAQNNTAAQNLAVVVNTGDSNGTLNGQYAGSFAGYDNGNWFVLALSFTADGEGDIVSGEYDQNKAGSGITHATITGGTYSIGSNGLGSITLDSSTGNFQVLVSTGNSEDMRIIAFSTGSSSAWGAGVLRQQNPFDFSDDKLAGNWVFGLQGFNPSLHPLAADGTYQEDSSGNYSGVEDINNFGTHVQATLTDGHHTSDIDSNGRFTSQVQISSGVGTVNHAVYVISANELVSIRIDNGGSLYVENNLRQSGTFNQGTLNGNAIGRGSRQAKADTSPQSEALVVQVATDGKQNISFTEDINSGGTVGQELQSGTYKVASNSRTVFTLTSGGTVVCYLIASNEGYCINATPASGKNVDGAEVIYFEPQSAGPFSDASFSGEYLGGSLPQYLSSALNQIDSNVSSGAATFSSTYTWSGPNGTQQNQTLNGTYNVDPTTGAITISVGGSPVYAGYLVSPHKVEYVTAATGSNPLVLIEVTSSAP